MRLRGFCWAINHGIKFNHVNKVNNNWLVVGPGSLAIRKPMCQLLCSMEIYGETFNIQSTDLLQGMQIQLLLTVREDSAAFTIVAQKQKCFYWGKEYFKKKKKQTALHSSKAWKHWKHTWSYAEWGSHGKVYTQHSQAVSLATAFVETKLTHLLSWQTTNHSSMLGWEQFTYNQQQWQEQTQHKNKCWHLRAITVWSRTSHRIQQIENFPCIVLGYSHSLTVNTLQLQISSWGAECMQHC